MPLAAQRVRRPQINVLHSVKNENQTRGVEPLWNDFSESKHLVREAISEEHPLVVWAGFVSCWDPCSAKRLHSQYAEKCWMKESAKQRFVKRQQNLFFILCWRIFSSTQLTPRGDLKRENQGLRGKKSERRIRREWDN